MSEDVDASTVAPSLMSSTTAASTAGTSPPTSPRSTADLRTELKTAQEAKAAADSHASVLEAELARFKDQFTFTHAAKEALEVQLREEIVRREKAEDQVESLRGAVEAARRGVMQLQKQESDRAARRQSGFIDEEVAPGGRKRQSLYLANRRPLSHQSEPPDADKKEEKPGGLRELRLATGASGHARTKSSSLRAPPPLNVDNLPTSPLKTAPASPLKTAASPNVQSPPSLSPPASLSPPKSPETTSVPTLPASPLVIPADRRTSTLSIASVAASVCSGSATAASSGAPAAAPTPATVPVTNEHIEQLKAARVETAALRAHIEVLEMKLIEADEAREASDDCLRALRDFLAADPGAGGGSVSLPPLPHEVVDDEPAPEPEKKGWGFGRWQATPAPDTHKRRGSSSATSLAPSVTSVTSPPPAAEAPLPPVIEDQVVDEPKSIDAKLDKPLPDPKKDEAKKDDAPKPEAKGWLAGWRSSSTSVPAPAPAPEPTPPEEGANLGRSLTSFFGRRARAASRAAAKAEADKADAEAYSKEEDAPLSSAVAAAAAAETSEIGFKLPSESEGSPKREDDTASRVAAAKAKAEALAAERAEKRRARAAERLPGALTADQILKAEEESTAKEAGEKKEEESKAEVEAVKAEVEKKVEKAKEDTALAYLAEPEAAKPAEKAEKAETTEVKPGSPSKPALSLATPDPAPLTAAEPASATSVKSALSPPSTTTKSPAFGFDGARASLEAPRSPLGSVRPRRNSPASSPVSPALSRGGSVPPSPVPDEDMQEELEDDKDAKDEDENENATDATEGSQKQKPKRPQRRNLSKRGRGGKAKVNARGGFV